MTPDTNILVRLIVRDDVEQLRLAEGEWKRALAHDGAFITRIAIVETAWVLRRAYKFDRATVAKTLRAFVLVEGVSVENVSEVHEALTAFEKGPADLGDYLIRAAARTAACLPVVTFDEAFSGEHDVRTPTATEPL
jgi:predicted nucleic-acid-binding protein